MKRYIRTSFLFLLLSGMAFAGLGGQRAGTSIYNFLKIDPSASSGGMGSAFTTMVSDASGIHWNPALSVQMGGSSAAISHLQWFDGIGYEYIALSHAFRSWALGFEMGVLHMDPMEITTEYNPYGSGEYFSYADYYFTLNYSRKMSDRFSFGTSARLVREEYLDLATTSLVVDLGTFYRTGFRDLTLAVALLNFGTPAGPAGEYPAGDGSMREYERYSPPTTFHLGASMTVYANDYFDLLTALQLNHPVDNAETYIFAIRAGFLKTLQLSAAYTIGTDMPFSLGLAFSAERWQSGLKIDYAFRPHRYLGIVNQIQVSYNF
ncbi:MAG: PorV/PorQ family protein [Candidatus Marinimicrobia bacterium]|nr:PorV/PorQ family protein [Candidatus Neomarinimicrobiota bacterium]MDD4961522.1 PorV/PorQ family protein [Candidatus Neomarinimicrobiota bacterium]MDD5710297.1 PorV/PorQ family protein [Candidatus Neomarinimicrobiota bacterium]